MNWLRENWFWLVIGGLFLWVHFKMHGGHSGHGGHGPHAGHGGAGCCGGHRQEEGEGNEDESVREEEADAQR